MARSTAGSASSNAPALDTDALAVGADFHTLAPMVGRASGPPRNRGTSLSEFTETWRLDGIGGVTGTPAVVNGVVCFGDWYGVVHLLKRHFPVRRGQADSLAAKR
jgi:hypothetical protein